MVHSLPNLDQEKIAAFCRKHRIRRLALFGSVVRDDFRPDSDVDVLVEFEPGATPGFGFFAIERELAEMFQRPVDLCTPDGLKKHVRERVLAQAREIYALN